MWQTIDLKKLPVVFISYDEPNADENFAQLLKVRPDALRVHGVKGFDAAHRAAGALANARHVITIDADNRLIDQEFLAFQLEFTPRELTCVISFASKVAHNGLVYGNGGLKIWPRTVLRTLRTHELDFSPRCGVDFAWNVPYVMAKGCPTETVVTGTPLSAFRAGYREGVRLTMHKGRTAKDVYPEIPPSDALFRHVPATVIDRLHTWCFSPAKTIAEKAASLGARIGCLEAFNASFDLSTLSDFDLIEDMWNSIVEGSDLLDKILDSKLQESERRIKSNVEAVYSASCAPRKPTRLGMLLPET